MYWCSTVIRSGEGGVEQADRSPQCIDVSNGIQQMRLRWDQIRRIRMTREGVGLLSAGIGVLFVIASWYAPLGRTVIGLAGLLSIMCGVAITLPVQRRSSVVVPRWQAALCVLLFFLSIACLVGSVYFDSRAIAGIGLLPFCGWWVLLMYLMTKQSWLRRSVHNQNADMGATCPTNSGQSQGPAARDHASRDD